MRLRRKIDRHNRKRLLERAFSDAIEMLPGIGSASPKRSLADEA